MTKAIKDAYESFKKHYVLYLVLLFFGIIMVFPFLWMLATSLKPQPEIYSLSLMPDNPR